MTGAIPAVPDCLDGLSVRERAALVTWPSVYSTDWESATAVVRDLGVGGVLLMRPSGWDADEARRALAELQALSHHGLVIATDEEGGDVQRLALLGPLASQQTISESVTPDAAHQIVSDHAALVRSVGIDVVFGPVIDVLPTDRPPPLQRSRFFTGGPDTVTAYASAYVAAWSDHDILPVLKHFPGHGAASADTHDAEGTTDRLSVLEQWDMVPFRSLAASGSAVMVGHLTVPDLTDGQPSTRSTTAIDYLRYDVGFDNSLVISDALGMAAVGTDLPDASVDAIAAGIDVAIFTDTGATQRVIDAIEQAVRDGRITETRLDRAARRVLAVTGESELGCTP